MTLRSIAGAAGGASMALGGHALAQAADATVPVAGQMLLPHDLSPWGMFLGADAVVKSVLIGLVLASVATWTIALAKGFEIWAAGRKARRARGDLLGTLSLADAHAQMARCGGVANELVVTAVEEVQRSGTDLPADGIKERIALRFQRIEAGEARRMLRGTGLLATIGATAPFIGLFGTVWGIMNSFIGISKAHTTNLAVVAPGIAEALLATAIGLAAAIPAVVIYNLFSRSTTGYRAVVGDASAEILRLVSRELDRLKAGPQRGRATVTAAE